jgi:hypothetical protein
VFETAKRFGWDALSVRLGQIKCCLSRTNRVGMPCGPGKQSCHRGVQRIAQLREGVLHTERCASDNSSLNKAVAFETAQAGHQAFLRDAGDVATVSV